MSYSFYSIVNTLKDKSSEAISTLSSDLKDFTAIVQEDVAEISKTVRQTMQEKSEQLKQRAEQDAAESDEEADAKTDGETAEPKEEAAAVDKTEAAGEQAESAETAAPGAAATELIGNSIEALRSSLFSFSVGTKIESLESMGSKLLNSADRFLGALSGENQYEDSDSEGENEELSARRFRLLALQEDSETYTEAPLDVETFQKWQAATPASELADVQAEVLEHYPTVRTKFGELVPSVVDSDKFWAHYIYKASLLAAQEQRGADLLEQALNDDEEEIGWDADSPKNEDKKSLFVEEESKEDPAAADSAPASAVTTESSAASASAAAHDDAKPSSSTSSDGESWIELGEQKEQQPPLSSSSAASTSSDAAEKTGAAAPAPAAFKPKDGAIAEGDDGLDWGDDDVVQEKTAKTSIDADKQGEDWGEWD